jgi:KaiC/GvpD/RAD55 family RecA-like ATPase
MELVPLFVGDLPRNDQVEAKPSMMNFKTFSPAFDKILGGGFPRSSLTLFEDSPLGFSWDLASKIVFDGLKEGEVGIYLTFDHSPSFIRNLLKSIDIDTTEYENSNRFFIINGFRWAEKQKDYYIKDPSSEGELANAFAAVRDSSSVPIAGKCRCLVDSSVAVFFVHGIEKLVSFALLVREISVKLGISSILISPKSIGRRVNNLLGYNSDAVIEFKVVEEGERLINKLRVKKISGQVPSSPWVTYTATGAEFSIQE